MADMTDSAPATSDVATPDKNAEEVMKALGKWYLACHAEDSNSPKCQAVTHLMQAVAEISGGPGSQPMDPAIEAAEGEPPMPPEGAMSPDMAPPDDSGMAPEDMALAEQAGPPPTSMADAAGQTQDMMLAAAKRRQP